MRTSLLDNWLRLNKALSKLPEQEVRALLAKELSGRKRASYAIRLHARLCQLMMTREREVLLSKCVDRRTGEKRASSGRLRDVRNKE